jgi:hypothetical protein
MFGYQSPWINQRPWYMKPVYDWSKCCPDNIDGETAWYQFLSLMKAIFGYQVGVHHTRLHPSVSTPTDMAPLVTQYVPSMQLACIICGWWAVHQPAWAVAEEQLLWSCCGFCVACTTCAYTLLQRADLWQVRLSRCAVW